MAESVGLLLLSQDFFSILFEIIQGRLVYAIVHPETYLITKHLVPYITMTTYIGRINIGPSDHKEKPIGR